MILIFTIQYPFIVHGWLSGALINRAPECKTVWAGTL